MMRSSAWRRAAGALMMMVLSVTMACVRLFTDSVARHLQVPDHLDRARAGFGLCVRLAAKHGACCGLSVERIAFSVLMPELTIGAVHFGNSIPLRLQKTRETRAI